MKIQIKDKFKIWGGDHDIDIEPGVTALVGRNCSGKTTTLYEVHRFCYGKGIIVIDFDGYSKMYEYSSLTLTGGQRILHPFFDFRLSVVADWIRRCNDIDNLTPVIITIDNLDCNLSISTLRVINSKLDIIVDDFKRAGVDVYILFAANSYELTKGRRCIDVTTGENVWFEDYENYANFICKGD